MVQEIKQGDIFGRVGSEFGKGLAESMPKEIERGRLAEGLGRFEKDSVNLNPMQQLARLSSIPGITPQMVQSFSELARHQNLKNAYANRATGSEQWMNQSSPNQNMGMTSALSLPNQQGQPQQSVQTSPQFNNQRTPSVAPGEITPEIVNENALNPAALTRAPWTPEQRDAKVVDYINQGFLPAQAKELASDDETRDLAVPGALQKRNLELSQKSEEARSEFRRQLDTKLQKQGEGVFKDVTGEMLINMERGLERDLRTNPNISFKDAANDWSNRALNVAKAKDQLNKLSETSGIIENILEGDKTLKKLRSYENMFKKSGNSEEYYNLLREKFALSPQGAATVAFPLNKEVDKYIKNLSPIHPTFGKRGSIPNSQRVAELSRKTAIDLESKIESDQSILAIARALSEKDPTFDQQEFFDQLNEDKDLIRLNDRQRRELAEGPRDIIPSWGDISVFPWFRRSTK